MLLGACSDVGRARETNEDAYYADDGVLVVADGMGGHNAGEVASQIAVEQVVAGLRGLPSLPDGMVEAFQAANAAVCEGARESSRQGMGTTLTCAVVRGGSVYVGHVGDSRAYLLRSGHLTPLSVDHSVVAELVRNGTLLPEEARVHPHRHLVTRAIGTLLSVPVDVQVHAVQHDDVILLCTDGLTAVVTDDEILQSVRQALSPQAAAEALVDMANSRGGPDNVTVVIGLIRA